MARYMWITDDGVFAGLDAALRSFDAASFRDVVSRHPKFSPDPANRSPTLRRVAVHDDWAEDGPISPRDFVIEFEGDEVTGMSLWSDILKEDSWRWQDDAGTIVSLVVVTATSAAEAITLASEKLGVLPIENR